MTRLAGAGRGATLRAARAGGAELVAAVPIFGLAVWERLWRIDLARVSNDEANAASLVAAWTREGLFPVTGIATSAGGLNPPAWQYLLAVGLVWRNQPVAALAVGLVFGLLAVGLCWWVGRRWLGPWGGLAAAVYYAGSFYPVFAGRTAWQPALLAAPTLLFVDAALMLAVRHRPWALAIACAWLSLLMQLHYVTAMLVVILLLTGWAGRHVLQPRHYLAGALAGLTPLVPFAVYALSPAYRLQNLAGMIGPQVSGADVDLSAFWAVWTLAGNGGAVGYAAPSVDALRGELGRWSAFGALGPVLALGGLVALLARAPRRWTTWLIAAWVILPIVVLARHSLIVYNHYLYYVMPGLALLVGALVQWAASLRRKAVAALLLAALVGEVAASTGTQVLLLDALDRTDAGDGYGIPLRFNLQAASVVRGMLPPGNSLLVGGPIPHALPLRFAIGYDLPSATFDDCHAVPYVPGALYLLTSERRPGSPALEDAGAPLLARVPRPGGDAIRLYGPPPAPSAPGQTELPLDRNLDACSPGHV